MVVVLASFSCSYIPFCFPSLPSVSTSKPFDLNHPSYLPRSGSLPRIPLRGDTLTFHGHSSPAGTLPVRRFLLLRRRSSADEESPGGPTLQEGGPVDRLNGGGGDGGEDWTTSVLLFILWAGLMYYVFQLTPDQTPSRDMYFLQKLLNLKGDDGFRMNQVLVALWYIMGLWPIVYSMLLLPSGRSSRSKVPVWPFLVVSFFAGAYGLIPYFILWRPPPPAFEEEEIRSWPLNCLESKITAAVRKNNAYSFSSKAKIAILEVDMFIFSITMHEVSCIALSKNQYRKLKFLCTLSSTCCFMWIICFF